MPRPKKLNLILTKEYLYNHYVIKNMSLSEITKEVISTKKIKITPKAIYYWMKIYNIPRRSEGARYGLYNPRYNHSGKLKQGAGYIIVRAPDKNPLRIVDKGQYILEHRLKAEEIISRPLKTTESVHHKDGNKENNNSNNLLVFSLEKHHQQYHQKLVHLAMDIFYGNLSSQYPELKQKFEELVKDIPIVKE